jgi:hypothetical protein
VIEVDWEKSLDFPEQGITLRYHSLQYSEILMYVREEGFIWFKSDAKICEKQAIAVTEID